MDTGASVSIIKKNILLPSTTIASEIINLSGISQQTIQTQGCAMVELNISDQETINHRFHIIDEKTNIPYHGILGNDFLRAHNVLLDFKRGHILLNKTAINIYHINKSSENSNSIILPPRSEILIKFKVLNPEIGEGIIQEKNLVSGVFLCRAITSVDNFSDAYATILNTTEKSYGLKQIELYLEPLPIYSQILHFETAKSNVKSERKNKISETIRTAHLNDREISSLLKVCTEFDDVFCLDGDKLSSTSVVQHEINTGDSAPIVSKTYRYPEIHKSEVNKQINNMLKDGIIKQSTSPWSAPLWVVPKKLDSAGIQKWRVVIDYRKLNNVTVGDAYPLPNISEILDQLGHSQYFTKLDLASGFHQIKVKEADCAKTAFSTPTGHYEFTRMPFGLKNAPATFQRLMNNVLAGLNGTQCFVYMDDIVIYAANLDDHQKKLINVFKSLRNNNLKLQPDKCEFLRKEVVYLGHLITREGVQPDPDKIKIIAESPSPTNVKEIKGFLGLGGYYRRFIENFALITRPLTKLLKKNANFEWTSDQQNAVDIIKSKLVSKPILQYPDFSKEFIVTTDASNYAIGAVLSQFSSDNSLDLPIAYAGRTLNRAESNYNTTERETLAILWSINHFRPYLYGRKFKIATDHRPLVWLFSVKDPGSRLIRWRLKMEQYNYEIIYKPGRVNSNADYLSRIPAGNINSIFSFETKEVFNDYVKFYYNSLTPNVFDFNETNENILNSNESVAYLSSIDLEDENRISKEILSRSSDPEVIKNCSHELFSIFKTNGVNNLVYYHCFVKLHHFDKPLYADYFYTIQNLKIQLEKDRVKSISIANPVDEFNQFSYQKCMNILLFVFRNSKIKITVYKNVVVNLTADQIPNVLKDNHDLPTSGHCGYHRMYNRIKGQYKWKGMNRDIKNYIKNCQSCQANKTSRIKYRFPMEITTTSSQPFEKLALDIVGPLPLTENGNKYVLTMQDDLTKFSYAVPLENHESVTVADNLVKFISMFGIPKAILTDQGTEFLSNIMKELNKLLRIKHFRTTAYHPQTNGALERSHSTLKDYLKHYINEAQTDWDKYIPWAMFSYNSHVHASTKYTPYELLFGHKPIVPASVVSAPEFRYTYESYCENLKYRMNKSHEIARENLLNSKFKSKEAYDSKIKRFEYRKNDLVYLENNQSKAGLSKKLTKKFNGPYKIVQVHDRANVSIQIGNKLNRVHVNRLKPFLSQDTTAYDKRSPAI